MKRKIHTLLLTGVCTAAIGGLTAGSAMAASVVAVTGGAYGVGTTTVALSGAIAPEGNTVSYEFQYGTSTTYGKTTAAVALPTTNNTVVATEVVGLTPGTTYDYRLVAVSAAKNSTTGAYYAIPVAGANATFTTATPSVAATSTVSLASTTAKVKSKKASVSLKCKGTATCKGTLTLDKNVKVTVKVKGKKKTETKAEKLGSASYSVAAGKTGSVTVKLDKTAVNLLKKGKLAGTATAKANKGLTGFKNKSLTLKS